MSIIQKLQLPDALGNEATKYNELMYKGTTRTTTGNLVFTSATSGETYSTLTSYSGTYANQGENGLFNLLKIEVLSDYLLDNDWVDSIDEEISGIDLNSTYLASCTVDGGTAVVNNVGTTKLFPYVDNARIEFIIDTPMEIFYVRVNGGATLEGKDKNGDALTVENGDIVTAVYKHNGGSPFFLLASRGGSIKTFFGDGSDGTIPILTNITTAPNGGTVANLWDMNASTLFTTNSFNLNTFYDIFIMDFQKPFRPLSMQGGTQTRLFRVHNISASTGSNHQLLLYWSDDGISWNQVGSVQTFSTSQVSINLDTTGTTDHRYWKVVVYSTASGVFISLQGVTVGSYTTDTVTDVVWRMTEPSTLNGGAVVKQYTSYNLPVGYEHTVQNPCQGLIIYSQGDVTINGKVDMSQKAGVAPNGNIIPMPIIPEYTKVSKTSSLLHFDNSLVDDNGRVWTNNGAATFDATNKKFGTHAISFNGVNQWIDTPASDDFSFGSDDFTIDFWVRSTNFATSPIIYSTMLSDGDNSSRTVDIGFTSGGLLDVYVRQNSTQFINARGNTVNTINNWYHIAVVRQGDYIKTFINGVLESIALYTLAVNRCIVQPHLGRLSTDNYFAGQIDEFRIIKGKAMYTSNFTPPTSAYTYQATYTDTVEAFKEAFQLTTVLQNLKGGYGGNGGYGGGYSGSTGRQSSVGIGGAGRQNLGGFGGGGSGGGASGVGAGGVGGSILNAEICGEKLEPIGIYVGSGGGYIYGYKASGGCGGFGCVSPSSNSSALYSQPSGQCFGSGSGGTCGAIGNSFNTLASQYSGGFTAFICKGNFQNTGSIFGNGGSGSAGGSSSSVNTGGGGGGGGAGGGAISVFHKGTYINSGTIQVNGGSGGSGGTGTGGETGGSGTSGSVGTINIRQI